MSFKELDLMPELLRAIEDKGYDTPSPIQEKAIPVVLRGNDVLASAQTGTGKTAGFTLPLLQRLVESKGQGKRAIRALVLTPTRELAAQIQENVIDYSKYLDIRSTVIFGGVKQGTQVSRIRQGIDVLVATPGRLIDLHNQRLLSLKQVEILVLDEADRMLDMGFLRDIERIMRLMPEQRQNLLFSATFSKQIKLLARGILNDPAIVEATPENSTAEAVRQKIYLTDKGKKTDLLSQLINEGNWSQVLIFTRTKHGANKLTKKLDRNRISAAAIHGDKSQNQRTKALAGFKNGTVRVLVATDIAARGLDIPLLPHVINFELPNVPEDYVHRIGRTGRAGASGEAISLVSVDEDVYLRDIQKLLGRKLKSTQLEGFEREIDIVPPAAPKQQGRGRGGNRGGGNPRGGNSGKKSFKGKKKSGSGGSSRGSSDAAGGTSTKQSKWRPKRR